jgi:hypothetical protein
MRNEIKTFMYSLLFVIVAAFIIFNLNGNLTGFAILEDDNSSLNYSEGYVSMEMANYAIGQAELIMKRMQESNLSVNLVNDTLIQARIVFEQAKYVEVLENDSSSEILKREARNALRLVNWREVNYSLVIVYTDRIANFEKQAFLIIDRINAEEMSNSGISGKSRQIFNDAKIAFSEERYNEADRLLEELKTSKEADRIQSSSLVGVKEGAKNFFQRYWLSLLVGLLIFLWAGNIIRKIFSKRLVERKIKRMKTEQGVLNSLIKKAQRERFNENKISGLVYNIRMKNYKERIAEIKEKLPILEARLKEIKF